MSDTTSFPPDAFCNDCSWLAGSKYTCSERADFLVSRYTLSKHEAISSLLDQGTCIDPSYEANDAKDEKKLTDSRSSNTSPGTQENIGSTDILGLTHAKASDTARTMVINAYNYNHTTNMTSLHGINIHINNNNTLMSSKFGLVIICMVIFSLYILFFQVGCSRTTGTKSLRKREASKRTKLRQVLPLLIAILIGMQMIFADRYLNVYKSNNEREINNKTHYITYIPATIEKYVVDHADELGYASYDNPRGCDIWKNRSATLF